MVNVFVLKGATSDLQLDYTAFMTEILYGMLERHFNEFGWDTSKLKIQKAARLEDFIHGRKY